MAPIDNSPSHHVVGGFELICSLKAENHIPVHKYKSQRTGLTVVIGEVEGPVVNGYFCLATEAHDDDGLPHTLEHLIFLGSEDYPYKGVLDLLANRCLASGTNAWTDVDHTCYTMTTAGSEGFLTLMPIYIEHILYPTLTDHGFVTEVHHITEEADDAGVVYCEMQGCENTGEERTHSALLQEMYPGDCGYKSRTGGVMKNLRESTTNAKVKQYHKDFYRPDNLTVIITGPVQPNEVFKALAGLEEKIISKGALDSFTRPWQNAVPPITKSIELCEKYPCDDEDNGLVYIGWRGPSAVKDLYLMNACAVLLKYLTDTSISPLQKEFVEVDDPLASAVGCSITENSESMLYLTFENVPTCKLDDVKPKLEQILKSFSDGKEKLDMKRLRTVVHRQMLERLSHLENSPHDAVAFMIIGDVLYGNTIEDLHNRLNYIEALHRMETESEEFWLGLLRKYMIEAPVISIKGRPSIDEQKRMREEEEKRVEKQRETLGEEGLKNVHKILRDAVENNETPPPLEMLTSVPIPSTASIHFHEIVRYTSDFKEQSQKFDLNQVPLYTQLDHVNTNFVYMFILMDTTNVSSELRPYLPLLLEAFLESPIQRGNNLISYEQIVAELEADTVATSTRLGHDSSTRFSCGPYSHTASIVLQLEEEKYEKGINWLNEILYNTVFTPERLKVIACKIANDVAQVKRMGNKIAWDLMKDIYYVKDSNNHVVNMIRQQQFLNELVDKISKSNIEEIIKDMEQVRKVLTNPANMVVHLALNLNHISLKYPNPAALWAKLLPADVSPVKKSLNVTPDYKLMLSTHKETKDSCIIGLGCIESSFFVQTAPCINDFNSPDLAPILVFLQYLSQLEGPMWREIRGMGLAYGYRIYPGPNEGLLYLSFYRATNVVEAYKQAKLIVEEQISKTKWDSALLESARSSLIFEIIQREKTVGDVVAQSLLSYFKGVDKDYNRNLVHLIGKVTIDDLNRVGKQYISVIFDPSKIRTTVVCSPSKAEEIAKDFNELQLELKVHQSLEDRFLK